MAYRCPHCGSSDTVPLVDRINCHNCGRLFGFDGKPATAGPDQNTRDIAAGRLADRAVVVGGNYADLQRAGAEAVAGSGKAGLGDVATAPPGTDSDVLVTPAEHEASRGEWTRETERTGLVDAPAAAEPADEVGGRSVDPGSQSPEPVKTTASRSKSEAKSKDS